MAKKLYRSKKDKMIAGVCGGLAEYTNVDPTVMRVLFVIATVFTGIVPGIIVYIALALIIPTK